MIWEGSAGWQAGESGENSLALSCPSLLQLTGKQGEGKQARSLLEGQQLCPFLPGSFASGFAGVGIAVVRHWAGWEHREKHTEEGKQALR